MRSGCRNAGGAGRAHNHRDSRVKWQRAPLLRLVDAHQVEVGRLTGHRAHRHLDDLADALEHRLVADRAHESLGVAWVAEERAADDEAVVAGVAQGAHLVEARQPAARQALRVGRQQRGDARGLADDELARCAIALIDEKDAGR